MPPSMRGGKFDGENLQCREVVMECYQKREHHNIVILKHHCSYSDFGRSE